MCKKQQPIVDRLSTDPKFAKVARFIIDFDSGKEHVRRFKVEQQGTLIAFKGTKETLRSVGQTDPDALRKVFEAAL
jgi:hypothetical protein